VSRPRVAQELEDVAGARFPTHGDNVVRGSKDNWFSLCVAGSEESVGDGSGVHDCSCRVVVEL